jgi:subtilisin family serine protease
MYAFQRKPKTDRLAVPSPTPSETLRLAITFNRPGGEPGLTKFNAPLSPASVRQFVPNPVTVDRAIYALGKRGFKVTNRGNMSISVRGNREQFEKVFGTKLERVDVDRSQPYAFHSFYYPPQDAPWNPDPELASLIDDAYIQWPHIYMATARAVPAKMQARPHRPSPKPPQVNYFHLDVPNGVSSYINASRVHAAGTTGKDVRVVMVDSGFGHTLHPFFASNGYRSAVDLAPNAINDKTDPNGHGTGESANVFSVAPGATFIGVKVDNDDQPNDGASLLEGFQTALQHDPQVISISMGYDLRDQATGQQLDELPNNLAALEAEIQSAIASGIIVVFSAGNGHFSFPGMMPDVISAGGVFVDEHGNGQASDYASAFDSKIYPGRHVPDFCGLVGLLPHANYIMLPIPASCNIDDEVSKADREGPGDGTTANDGWGVFSGTSAAAPQLAGVCALLLEKDPTLSASDIKAVLRRTARDVLTGHSNPASSDDDTALKAGAGDDGATGAGLVDAYAAWQQV